MFAGEILLQPRKPFFRFHIHNTVAEISVLRQQVKKIAHQHTEGAAGNDVGGIIGGSGTLLFPDFCVMLFQNGGQRRKLRCLQLGKVRLVAKHQIATGASRQNFSSAISTIVLCRLDQICHILLVLHLSGKERDLMEQPVQMYLIIDMVFIGTLLSITYFISCPILSLSAFPIVGNLAGLCREKSV